MGIWNRMGDYVNLEIKDYCIRYVELKSKSPIVVKEMDTHYLPHGIVSKGRIIDFEMLEAHLTQCVEKWNLRRKKVRLVIPDVFVVVRKINVPSDVKEDEIKGYLYFELGSTIHLPFENPVIDFVLLDDEEKKREVLMFAAPEDVVLEYVNVCEDVKLRVASVDVSALCIYRVMHHLDQGNQPTENVLVAQINVRDIVLTTFKGVTPLFSQQLEFAYEDDKWEISKIDEALSWNGDMDELRRYTSMLNDEIDSVIRFYQYSVTQGKAEISRIIVTGDHPMLKTYLYEIQEHLSLPVQFVDLHLVECDSKHNPMHYLVPLGLSLKE